VELMGGQIGIEQGSSGQGTQVWLTVPVVQNVVSRERVAVSQLAAAEPK
jgi:hypothetical protein